MMIDNLQLEPLSVQFCGELMPQAHIDMCSIFDICNHYLTVRAILYRHLFSKFRRILLNSSEFR